MYSVPAAVWSDVSCEDHRISELLQLYFTIEHPFYGFVDRDAFLDDMVAGRERFYSSLLANALPYLVWVGDGPLDLRSASV